jgi:membrane associated rhomboid family serine protease
MIPIRDNIKSRSVPLVVLILIFLNAFVFVVELSLGAKIEALFMSCGFVPESFFSASSYGGSLVSGCRFFPLFSSMFLHGGWMHLIGNMLFLWVFGDNVEDHLGKIKFIVLYFGSGAFASLLQGVTSMNSKTPLVGASGAIAGVLGAYFLLFPFSKVTTLIPILIFPLFIDIPAAIFLLYWFFIQFFNGALSLAGSSWTQVAWWAHIGGFLLGLFFTLIFGKAKRTYS